MAIQLALIIKGKTKTFTADGINMRASIEAYELLGECEASGGVYTPGLIEKLTRFVVQLFDRQFNEDELMDGCMDSFFRVVPAMLRSVIEGVSEAVKVFPVNPTTAAKTEATA